MLEELAKNPYINYGKFIDRYKTRKTLSFLKPILFYNNLSVLDVGQHSPLTDEIEKYFNIKLDNTTGDLDVLFTMPKKNYDVIIYSHTIEHQFNPLYTLIKLKDALKNNGRIYIFVPDRNIKLLWSKGHYHEIDTYRMYLICKRVGLQIIGEKSKLGITLCFILRVFGHC